MRIKISHMIYVFYGSLTHMKLSRDSIHLQSTHNALPIEWPLTPVASVQFSEIKQKISATNLSAWKPCTYSIRNSTEIVLTNFDIFSRYLPNASTYFFGMEDLSSVTIIAGRRCSTPK